MIRQAHIIRLILFTLNIFNHFYTFSILEFKRKKETLERAMNKSEVNEGSHKGPARVLQCDTISNLLENTIKFMGTGNN